MRLKGKVAIITGAAQGIGAAYAVGFAKEGAKIVVSDILDGNDTIKQIENEGGVGIFVKTDVGVEKECQALAKATADRFGGINILINNAAVFGSLIQKPFMEITSDEFKRVIDINTSGAFHCIKAVFPYMKEKGGKIINISSSTILMGVPGMAHYVASKGAIMALTRCMAKELGPFNINVNTIAPGYTHSDGGERVDARRQFPSPPIEEIVSQARSLNRPAFPEDLVGAALFLASDDSAYITGQMIVHDGGLSFH